MNFLKTSTQPFKLELRVSLYHAAQILNQEEIELELSGATGYHAEHIFSFDKELGHDVAVELHVEVGTPDVGHPLDCCWLLNIVVWQRLFLLSVELVTSEVVMLDCVLEYSCVYGLHF